MNTAEKTELLARLHVKGAPLILYNCWDAGSAKAIAGAGARVVGTSSWAMAEAHGYRDGQAIPFDLLERVVSRIVAACDLPVTVDFEGGFSDNDEQLVGNVTRLLDLGVVGINFEDRIVEGAGLYGIARQSERIAAIRAAADRRGTALFINARTDLFLSQPDHPARCVGAALERGAAYARAGASGFFVPGLLDPGHVARVCDGVPLPVNVMMGEGAPTTADLAQLGVSRVSYGPTPYIRLMEELQRHAGEVTRGG